MLDGDWTRTAEKLFLMYPVIETPFRISPPHHPFPYDPLTALLLLKNHFCSEVLILPPL